VHITEAEARLFAAKNDAGITIERREMDEMEMRNWAAK
jgi:hypothetical protein